MPNNEKCSYVNHLGERCHSHSDSSHYCYWHDPEITKSSPDTSKKLEEHARAGGMLHGIFLKNANLENLNLVKRGSKKGFDLTGADLYRANLRGAHLFNIILIRASLMKADLSNANIHCAHLEECNLLGVKLTDTKIEHIRIGKTLIQENSAKVLEDQGEHEKAKDFYEQAEEIYRNLRKTSEHQGLFTLSGPYLRKELTMRRFQEQRCSMNRVSSKVVDLFCGYGEDPLRVIMFSWALILFSSFFYYVFGLRFAGEFQVFSMDQTLEQNIIFFFECLYYSVVTFTTLGYGDFIPVGFSRVIAALEAFTGSFTIALFVVVFVKKMTR
ncbi:pentapeptide repeat-containing protein [Psychromonas sp. Urea-02u-13]|uniref:pentapeptide repeat-containing protein n=1 Tax=Psychromonas sp. Urea-02u-13 TaxID=2058326 RepID=UPI000C326AD8|nr:pentapeptide repeat-containing protein [Psychromonas sp. Urea-02u-13]PKG38189.1 potassium transporter Kef [Psychromonas sp. Urea-02u-13]